MMPAIDLAAARPARRWLPRLALSRCLARLPSKSVVGAMAFVVAVALLSHLPNMLHYPYVEDDEGTYFSQAWAVFHEGRLAPYPYTYFYDHVPLGWIQIGLWQLLSGGASFGYSVASGRVLMLLFQLGSSLLVFFIGRKASGRIWIGVLAALIFTLTPFGIFYQRRVLLDNIAAFWILVSLWGLSRTVTLRRIWLSAVALGIAVLSKEIAAVMVPAMAVLAARQAPKESRLFAVVSWVGLAGAVVSLYPLMALLRDELFPAGTALGGYHRHVSLLCSLSWQAGRGVHDGGILNPSSTFWTTYKGLAHSAPLLVIGGSLAAIVAIVLCHHNAVLSMTGWLVLSFWMFFGQGGMFLAFYALLVLPLLALCLALVASRGIAALASLSPVHWSRTVRGMLAVGLSVACSAVLAIAYQRDSGGDLWRKRPAEGQIQAIHWIQRHVPPDSRMVIDMYMWPDLQHPSGAAPTFRYAEYYWKAAEDPAVVRNVFSNSWRKVQYVITSPQLVMDTQRNGFPMIIQALNHSQLIAHFDSGWPIDIRKVEPRLPSNHKISPVAGNNYKVPPCMTYGT